MPLRTKDGQNHGRCGTGADSGSPTLRSQPLITGNQPDDERQKRSLDEAPKKVAGCDRIGGGDGIGSHCHARNHSRYCQPSNKGQRVSEPRQ